MPDLSTADQLAQFAEAVFQPDDIVEIRRLPSGRSTWHLASELPTLAAELAADSESGEHIYIGANPRRRKGGRSAKHVKLARCLIADFDITSPDEAQSRCENANLPVPTMTVMSGHGVHTYWRLDNAIEVGVWSDLQRDLAALLESDSVIHDAPRILRLPGFTNHKPPPTDAYIIDCDPKRVYPAGEILEHIPPRPAPVEKSSPNTPAPAMPAPVGRTLKRARAYAAAWPAVDEGGRNASAMKHAAALTRDFALSDSDAWALLQSWNETNNPPLSEAELRKTLASGRQYGSHAIACKADEPQPPSRENGGPADSKEGGENEKPRKTISTKLIEIAAEAELFHDPEGEAYATVGVARHHETMPIRSKAFRRWLSHEFYKGSGGAPNAQSLQDALTVIGAQACFDGSEYGVFVRVAAHNNSIWIDQGSATWDAIEVTSSCWRVCESLSVPVKFRRARGMLALPTPVSGGSVDALRPFLNLRTNDDWQLIVSCLVAWFRPTGPYPVLCLQGEAGTAKSTVCEILRMLIDPNVAPRRAEPREGRDLMIAAKNSWVLCFDNLSRVQPWLSDAFCRLATGGGFAVRELYSDSEEVLFDAMRAIVLNGIDSLATRGDLSDRSIVVELEPLSEHKRRPLGELLAAFEAVRPAILGALLDAVVVAVRDVGRVRLDRLPRMADFALWSYAAAPALGWSGDTFLAAYTGNRASAVALSIESAAIGPAIEGLMSGKASWKGSARELITELGTDGLSDEATRRRKDWPATPERLARALRRLAPELRRSGIDVSFHRVSRKRLIHIEKAGADPSLPSLPSLLSKTPATAPSRGLINDGNDSNDDLPGSLPSCENGDSESAGSTCDGSDGNDSTAPAFSFDDDAEVQAERDAMRAVEADEDLGPPPEPAA